MMKQKVAPTSKTKWQRTQIYAKAEAGVCVSLSPSESRQLGKPIEQSGARVIHKQHNRNLDHCSCRAMLSRRRTHACIGWIDAFAAAWRHVHELVHADDQLCYVSISTKSMTICVISPMPNTCFIRVCFCCSLLSLFCSAFVGSPRVLALYAAHGVVLDWLDNKALVSISFGLTW